MLEVADDDALVAGPVQFADPEHLGDFLYGLFTLAREPVQRRRDLIERIDEVVMAFADGEFLEALPALRRAFSVFTPREKDRLARSLPGGAGVGVVDSAVAPETLVAMLELEARLRDGARDLRGAVVSARAARALAARARAATPRARSALRRDRAHATARSSFLYDA